MSDPRDPAELFVVLTESHVPIALFREPWNADKSVKSVAAHSTRHVTVYVPKSDLDAARARVAELEDLVESLRTPATKWRNLMASLAADAERRERKSGDHG